MVRFRAFRTFLVISVVVPSLLAGCGASGNAALAAGGGCGLRVVFFYRTGGVRGYPLDASGETQPCALSAPLYWFGGISVSRFGYLHVAEFQSGSYSYPIYAPNANGNANPFYQLQADIDRFTMATDSHVTDYVADGTSRRNCWDVSIAPGVGPPQRNCTTDFTVHVEALATEPDDRLVVVMSDFSAPPRIEVYANASSTTPQLVQTITGSATLLPAGSQQFGAATDPVNGDIYLYAAGQSATPRVLVFASNANGNVAPKRVLNVPDATGWGAGSPGISANVVALDDRGQLYLALRTNVIVQVYAAGASGNAAPVRTITDASAPTTDQGGGPNLIASSVAIRTTIH